MNMVGLDDFRDSAAVKEKLHLLAFCANQKCLADKVVGDGVLEPQQVTQHGAPHC